MQTDHPLKAYREQQTPPMRRAELSRFLGVAKTTIKRWETGERQIDVDLLPGIAEKTGIPPRELRRDLVERHEEIFGDAQ